MWLENLLDKLTSFIPRPILLNPSEGGFRQTPKPWSGWPWDYWPWIRLGWFLSGENPVPEILKTGSWYNIYCPCFPKKVPWNYRSSGTNCWITEMEPGNWYWIVPLFMEHLIVPVKPDVKDIRIQSSWTSDGRDVAIGVSIKYYVSNPMKAILEVTDYDESIQNIALGVVSDYVEKHTEEELRQSRSVLKEEILKALRDESSGWGLRIQSVKITDVGRTQNFRILMDDRIGFKVGE